MNLLEAIGEQWHEGRHRDAFALLYSGAVASVDAQFTCGINESDTEGDCLRKAHNIDKEARLAFAEITNAWLRLAYGNDLPSDKEFEAVIRLFKNDIYGKVS